MATLLLTAAAGGAASALGLGTLATTALGLGAAIGGRLIDQALFGPGGQTSIQEREGPRLENVSITASTEGAAITRLYGRSRLSGQIIWATRLEEQAVTSSESTTTGGGKGGGGGGTTTTTTTTSFLYFANFAVGLCEGEVSRIGRIWADGRELDQEQATIRKYRGTEGQAVDSLIEAKEGAGNAPAYRGLAYIVFERLPLADFGNRIPQITAEVFRPVGRLEGSVRGVCIIPGTTEFGYEPGEITRGAGLGRGEAENRHSKVKRSDWLASQELRSDLLSGCAGAVLVVAWFGDDLRCGVCEIKPKVESAGKRTSPRSWSAGGLTRATAELVSSFGGSPAYGGAPDDQSVINAIQDMKERGLFIVFYPFIMMDIPAGNGLPDPYSDNAGATGQPPHPWRGRITCSPAPGFSGSPDKTSAAADQVADFLGAAAPGDFTWSEAGLPGETAPGPQEGTITVQEGETEVAGEGTTFTALEVGGTIMTDGAQARTIDSIASDTSLQVASPWSFSEPAPSSWSYAAPSEPWGYLAHAAGGTAGATGGAMLYSGPEEWSYRRFVLHMARLCEAAGGVDAFCIGSEMVGLTTVRDGATSYPFVAGLKTLAADVRSVLGAGTKIGYAADWSEYHSHRPDDGSGDVIFHLDPLWADAEIDFVGIDNYLPLSDWRDGTAHLDFDAESGPTTIYDQAYLKTNVEGGEHYDWFYASDADRAAQARTPIADSAHGEHWVFRNKDIRGWWQSAHHNRPGGVRSGSSTAWVPEGKPIWFTELGIPAVDKGTNQPNVFFDPKSSESFFPHFSSGARDDAIQRAGLQAAIDYWEDDGNNPLSGVYSGRMIDTGRVFVWAWDARMAPSFPEDSGLWADAENWDRGHWISGRVGAAPATETVERIFADYGFGDGTVEPLGSVVDALIADRVLTARQLLEAAAAIHGFDAVESQGRIKVVGRVGRTAVLTVGLDDLVEPAESAGPGSSPGDRYVETRAQETELPDVVKLTYGEPASDDQPGAVEARRLTGGSRRTVEHQLPAVMHEGKARAIAEIMLHEAWVGREALELALPPSLLRLDPGDVIDFAPTAESFRLVEVADAEARRLRAVRTEAALFEGVDAPRRSRPPAAASAIARPASIFMDGPLLGDEHADHAGYVAAFAAPWPGGIALHRSPSDTGFVLDQVLGKPATMGTTAFPFFSGPVWRWDRGNELWVDLFAGQLASAEALQVLGGANAIAVENQDGEWEIVQFATAELMATRRYKLTKLLRGQRGSEHAMRSPVPVGARVLLLDLAVSQPAIGASDVGLPLTWKIGPAGRDIADESYDTRFVTIAGKGRRPLSPVHLAAEWEADGDIHLGWIRRTRIGGDSWGQSEVPLGEAEERYALEILSADGSAVVRTVSGLGAPAWLYQVADQEADFGAAQGAVRFRVRQVSAAFGRGIAAEYP